MSSGEVDLTFVDGEGNGTTDLEFAVKGGLVDLARHLLDLGVDKELAGDKDQTPLVFACAKDQTEMTKLLVERGADVNAKNTDGTTALMNACFQGM
jgi:ankyrin repeat protein